MTATEVHSELYETSKMGLFSEIVIASEFTLVPEKLKNKRKIFHSLPFRSLYDS